MMLKVRADDTKALATKALLRQCDELEAQLRQTRTLGAHLLDATFHHHRAA